MKKEQGKRIMDTVYTQFDTKIVSTSDGKLLIIADTSEEFENCGWELDMDRYELTLTADKIVPGWTVRGDQE